MNWKNRKTHWYQAVSSALNFPLLKEESRRVASFLMLSTSIHEEVSENCFVFDLVKLKNKEVSQTCCVFDVVKFKN